MLWPMAWGGLEPGTLEPCVFEPGTLDLGAMELGGLVAWGRTDVPESVTFTNTFRTRLLLTSMTSITTEPIVILSESLGISPKW